MPFFNNIQSILITEINNAKKNLKISVTWFTNHEIFNTIINKVENSALKVELIVLNDRINNKKVGVNFQRLIDNKCDFYYSNNDNMVHNKFCIIDENKVITGSYNWTYYAENRNWENITIIKDKIEVDAYINEFDKIISNHQKILKTSESQNQDYIEYSDYLKTDYLFQAKSEAKKGNDLNEAKIYTELLKLDKKQPKIINARESIIKKYNSELFEVSPFEIGIIYENGYKMVIPAFEKLPITVIKKGNTTVDNQEEISITIQKFEVIAQTIKTLNLTRIEKSPKNTEKIEITFKLEKSGSFSIILKELNGGNRIVKRNLNIKKYI